MSRLKRRNRTDINYVYSGSILHLVDNAFKQFFRINDAEYDFIACNLTDEDLSIISGNNYTFSDKRFIVNRINDLLYKYDNNI